jgi:selenocysteine-specific elongation factor
MLIATAGHIDHGKTTLVRALSGVDTDRLPEEKTRGITIDLGFAYWLAAPGLTIGFVDVPGHEKFVRTMVAGVSAVDFALLVIAADDGIMPQTREHLEILDLLKVGHGAVAITKIDRVEPQRVAQLRAEIAEWLAPPSPSLGANMPGGVPIFAVSAATGAGIPELTSALVGAARAHQRGAATDRLFRFAVDRSFSISGAGTVCTGTVLDGSVAVGDRIVILPAGTEVRVRGLQSAAVQCEQMAAGNRCAINLAGIEAGAVHRGDWLCAADHAGATSRFEAHVQALSTADGALRHDSPVHLHIGTGDHVARVLIGRQRAIPGGSSANVRVVLETPIACRVGDRFVIRDFSGRRTLGGGMVIDPFPSAARRRPADLGQVLAALALAAPEQALAALLAIETYEIDLKLFAARFGITPAKARSLALAAGAGILKAPGELAVLASRLEATHRRVTETLEQFHRNSPEAAGITLRELRQRTEMPMGAAAFQAVIAEAIAGGAVERTGAQVRLAGFSPAYSAIDRQLWSRTQDWQEVRGLQAFSEAELVAELRATEATVRAMLYKRVRAGSLCKITDRRFMLAEQVAQLAQRAAKVSSAAPDGFTAAQFRDEIGTGRTLAIQILEYFDRTGVTSRRGDLRRVREDYTLQIIHSDKTGRA